MESDLSAIYEVNPNSNQIRKFSSGKKNTILIIKVRSLDFFSSKISLKSRHWARQGWTMGSWLSRNITDTQIIPLYLTIDIDNSLMGVCSAEDVDCLALNFVIQLHTTFVQVFGKSLYHQQVGQILLWRDFMWVPYTISRKAAAYFRRCPPPSVAFLARCECPVLASHCSKQELFFLPHLHHSLTQSSHGKF